MSKFIATGSARKVHEQMYFDRLDSKRGKEPKIKGGDSIWDQMTNKESDSKPQEKQ